jgi:Protein of unknown function (DUF2934)
MTLPDFLAKLTGEELVIADTGDIERPTQSEIARLAYDFYERRGGGHGHDVDDWLSAERELRHHYR